MLGEHFGDLLVPPLVRLLVPLLVPLPIPHLVLIKEDAPGSPGSPCSSRRIASPALDPRCAAPPSPGLAFGPRVYTRLAGGPPRALARSGFFGTAALTAPCTLLPPGRHTDTFRSMAPRLVAGLGDCPSTAYPPRPSHRPGPNLLPSKRERSNARSAIGDPLSWVPPPGSSGEMLWKRLGPTSLQDIGPES